MFAGPEDGAELPNCLDDREYLIVNLPEVNALVVETARHKHQLVTNLFAAEMVTQQEELFNIFDKPLMEHPQLVNAGGLLEVGHKRLELEACNLPKCDTKQLSLISLFQMNLTYVARSGFDEGIDEEMTQ